MRSREPDLVHCSHLLISGLQALYKEMQKSVSFMSVGLPALMMSQLNSN